MKRNCFILLLFLILSIPVFAQTDNTLFVIGDVKQKIQRKLEDQRKLNEAIDELSNSIDIDPSNAALYIKRAAIFVQLNNKEAVLKDVNTAFLLKPDDMDLLYEGARQLYLSGQYEESIKIGDYLISMNNWRSSIGNKIRYLNRFQLKDYAGTIEDVIESKDIFGAFDEGKRLYLDSDNSLKHTQGLLSITLDKLKDDPCIFEYYDRIFNLLEERKEGPSTTGSGYHWHSVWVAMHTGYAKVYEEKHTAAETKAFFDKFALDYSLGTRADIYKELGKYDAAINDLTKILQTTKCRATCLLGRGDLYFLNKQYEKALSDYEAALKNDENLRRNLGEKIALAKKKLSEKTNQQKNESR